MREGQPGGMPSETFARNSPDMYTAVVHWEQVCRQKINQERDVRGCPAFQLVGLHKLQKSGIERKHCSHWIAYISSLVIFFISVHRNNVRLLRMSLVSGLGFLGPTVICFFVYKS